MRTAFVMTVCSLWLVVGQIEAEAQTTKSKVPLDLTTKAIATHNVDDGRYQLSTKVPLEERTKNAVPYLSIGDFYARRDPKAAPPRITVAGYYHNYNRQTVSGATFSIERWNGNSWTRIKSGPLNPILANKGGAESIYLPFSNDALKVRFVVSKSIEGSKVFQLDVASISAGVRSKFESKEKLMELPPEKRTTKSPYDLLSPSIKAKIPTPYLSINRVYAIRSAATIIVRGNLSNPNLRTVAGATYTFERWNVKTGWSTVKSDKLPAVAYNGAPSVFVVLPMSSEAGKFRLRVSQSVEGSKECELPAQVFVVKYRCPDWQVYRSFEQDSSFIRDLSAPARQMRDLGFQLRVQDTYHDNFFSTYHSIRLSYRLVDLQQRSFPTLAAARAFQRTLPKQGVLSNIVEP